MMNNKVGILPLCAAKEVYFSSMNDNLNNIIFVLEDILFGDFF